MSITVAEVQTDQAETTAVDPAPPTLVDQVAAIEVVTQIPDIASIENQSDHGESVAIDPTLIESSIEAAADEVVPPMPELKWPLPHNCLSEMGQSNMSWTVVAHPGTVPEQYHLNPVVFKNIAEQFSMFDKVQLLAPDASWWADFLVVEMGRDAASLHLLQSVYLDTGEDRQDVIPGFQIRRAQPGDGQPGWILVNRETGNTLNMNLPILSYQEAVHFLTHSSQVHGQHRSSGLVG